MHIDTPVKRLAPTPAAALVHEAALRAAYLAEMAAQRGAAAQRDATALTATAAEQTRSPDALSLGQVPLIKPANWASMSRTAKKQWIKRRTKHEGNTTSRP
jgi:hypothetical protein